MNILVPPSSTNIDTSAYTFDTIQAQTNTTIVYTWCVKNIDFPNSPYQDFCWETWVSYMKGIMITVGISLVIVVFKYIVKIIMIRIAKFQRYTTATE